MNMKRNRIAALAVLAVAAAPALAACGGDDGGDGGSGGERHDAAGQRLRQLRLRGPLRRSSRPTTPASPSSSPPRATSARTTPSCTQKIAGRQRCRRRGRDRGGPGRQLPAEPRQVREPAGPRLQRPAGPVAALEVRAGDDRRRQRTRSVSAPTSAGWRCATAATCSSRPACRPTATRSASSGRPGTTSSPPASSSRTGIGDDDVHFIDSATNTYNSILMQSGRRDLLRPRGRPHHRVQPGRQGRLGPGAGHGRRRHQRQAEVLLQRVERRLQERRVRHAWRARPG